DFFIEEITEKVLQVNRSGEQPVFITKSGNSIYFSLDLGGISEIGSKELYFKLLDLNTEILPVSIGIDTTDESDHRLVLVESRECSNLDRNELLSVFDALEIAEDKVESTLAEFIK
ncbi:MAG: CesT family type III secretion system chaperone, partial [Chitinispirillia bacterium]